MHISQTSAEKGFTDEQLTHLNPFLIIEKISLLLGAGEKEKDVCLEALINCVYLEENWMDMSELVKRRKKKFVCEVTFVTVIIFITKVSVDVHWSGGAGALNSCTMYGLKRVNVNIYI